LKSADGTDDAQIIVTVVDTNGRALSNSPPVTLTVVSGPGQFPTGPEITFAPDSEIAILDGEAAIEFRSYYAGKTVIHATSPGLKDGTITITTQGGPKFIPGKMPPVALRPYVRFAGQLTKVSTATANSIFALNNPTLASSEEPAHTARFGNDGDISTYWQPQEDDANPWWQVDLEREVTMKQTKITFPSEGNYHYKVEISNDGQRWIKAADQTQTAGTSNVRMDLFANEISGHLLRVTFSGTPAAIAEIEILGRLTAQ
jgi:hypothetical protein